MKTATPDERPELYERQLLPALPALLALLAAIIIGLLAWSRGDDDLVGGYAEIARSAFEQQDYPLALIAFTRLVEFEPSNDRFRFGLALTAHELQQPARALALMSQLAPADSTGFVPAHLWMANRALAVRPMTADTLREAEYHLLRVAAKSPEATEVHTMLGQLYMATGRLDMAEPYLNRAVVRDPQQALLLARLHALRGSSLEAGEAAATAERVFSEMAAAEPENASARIRWAEALLLQGEDDRAEQVLRDGLEELPQGPFAAALVNFYRRRAQLLVDDPHARLEALSKAAEILDSRGADNPETHALTAGLFVALDKLDDAERHLTHAAEQRPELGLDLARLHAARGADEKARKQAEETLEHLLAQVARQPGNDIVRLLAANAAMWLERFEQAEEMLKEGTQISSQQRGFKAALAQLYVVWWNTLELHRGQGQDVAEQQLEVLKKGVAADQGNFEIAKRLLYVAHSESPQAETARRLLDSIDPLENVPPSTLLMLGTDAAQRGDYAAAVKFLDPAYQLQRESVVIANNLAWALAFANKPDLERALKIADAAVKQNPDNLSLRDTRGRILAGLGQFTPARQELEAAAPAMNGRPGFHAALAVVYQRLGRGVEAQLQRQLAQQAGGPPGDILPRPNPAGSSATMDVPTLTTPLPIVTGEAAPAADIPAAEEPAASAADENR